MFNLYEQCRPLMRRRRWFTVRADCQIELEFKAKHGDEAEDLFNAYCEAVEYRHPEINFEIRAILEKEWER